MKLPNELGIYDMSGNVWEWCMDHWHEDYYNAPDDGTSWVTGGEYERRVIRGGSWYYTDLICQISVRNGSYLNDWDYDVGFRIAGNIQIEN